MGFVAPMIVGFIINGQNDVDHWKLVFWTKKMSRLGNYV